MTARVAGDRRRWLGHRRQWLGVLPLIAAVLPPALIAWIVASESQNVPFWDEWEFVDFLDRARAGTLRFADLWAQHNEHRLVLPKLLMLGLARATAWDVRACMAASVLVALGTLIVLGLLLRRTLARSAPTLVPWVFLGASMLTFSIVQWQNWLWGWQVQVFINVLAACLTVSALARYGPRWPGPVLAMLAATAGCFSFANGITLFVVVPVALALDPRGGGRSWRRMPVVLTALVGGAIATIYLHGFTRAYQLPSPRGAVGRPLGVATYILAYLGSPFASGVRLTTPDNWTPVIGVSSICGALGLTLLVLGGGWLWTRRPEEREALLPWFAIALFAVLSGTMTGVGRIGMSLASAMASRYTTVSALFWVSVLAVGALVMAHLVRRPTIGRARTVPVIAVAALEVLAVVGYSTSSLYGVRMVDDSQGKIRLGAECLRALRLAPDPCLRLLDFDAALLRDRVRRLEALGLGPWAPGRIEAPLASYALAGTDGAGRIDFVATDPTGTQFVVVGWGMDPTTQQAARAVLVVVDGEVMGRAAVGLERPDIARGLRAAALARSGWTFGFGAFRLGPGSHALDAYVVLERARLAKLAGSRVIEVKRPT